jgi:hypothetical protein
MGWSLGMLMREVPVSLIAHVCTGWTGTYVKVKELSFFTVLMVVYP